MLPPFTAVGVKAQTSAMSEATRYSRQGVALTAPAVAATWEGVTACPRPLTHCMPGPPPVMTTTDIPRHCPVFLGGRITRVRPFWRGSRSRLSSPCCHGKHPGAYSPQDSRIRAMGYRGGGGSGSCVLRRGGALGGFLGRDPVITYVS